MSTEWTIWEIFIIMGIINRFITKKEKKIIKTHVVCSDLMDYLPAMLAK